MILKERKNLARQLSLLSRYRPVLLLSAATSSLGAAERDVLLPGSSAPTNRALNHEVSRDARILAVIESGLDKRQTPNPGEA